MRRYLFIAVAASLLAGCAETVPATCVRDSDSATFEGKAVVIENDDGSQKAISYTMIDGNNFEFEIDEYDSGRWTCTTAKPSQAENDRSNLPSGQIG